MKKEILRIVLGLLILAVTAGFMLPGLAEGPQGDQQSGKIVVANRGSGTISLISARTNELIDTYALPAGENPPEPMYVVYTPKHNQVYVGDRANNRVVVFDARDFRVKGTVLAGAGVFHMWADRQGKQLWVNNDIDNSTTVIDPRTLEVLGTVPTPADLVAQGGKPHDVILGPNGKYGYVSVLGLPGENDYVVQYSTETFAEVNRAPVGKDPHLSLAQQHAFLYVPSQNSDVVVVLNRITLAEVTEIAVPGAHGAGMTRNGRIFYTTNLPGDGVDGLYAIDTRTNTVRGEPVDTPYPVPHNIALTPSGKKIFITHSGAGADKVTVYHVPGNHADPVFSTAVTVGLNPFGLAYVP